MAYLYGLLLFLLREQDTGDHSEICLHQAKDTVSNASACAAWRICQDWLTHQSDAGNSN